MNILLIGPDVVELAQIIRKTTNDLCFECNTKFDTRLLKTYKIDFIISYRYRHILSKEIIDYVGGRAINLHTSYLPWNRGADPNLWSILENTPKGVSIHYMDEGLDTGPIVARSKTFFLEDDTLKTSYNHLHKKMLKLFRNFWPVIREQKRQFVFPEEKGSYHSKKDKAKVEHLLTNGWDTTIKELKQNQKNMGGKIMNNLKTFGKTLLTIDANSTVFTKAQMIVEDKVLIIHFNTGTTYLYTGVDASTLHSFVFAESKGSFFAKKIRNEFPCFKIA